MNESRRTYNWVMLHVETDLQNDSFIW